jgi:hypothetical protein
MVEALKSVGKTSQLHESEEKGEKEGMADAAADVVS